MPTYSSSTVVSRLVVAASVAALSLSARAADITWENKTGDWTQDELWNGGVAPGPEDVVSFKSGEMTITNAVEFGQEFHIGNGGTGVLTIEATGSVTGSCYHVGRDGGNGTMIVDGGSVKATFPSSNWYGCFNIGYHWNKQPVQGLVQLNSGTIEANQVSVGRTAGAVGRLEISGGELIDSGDFNIGNDGLDEGSGNTSHGEVVITGGKLLANVVRVANGSSSSGTMTVKGGVVNGSATMSVASGSASTGSVLVEGGVVNGSATMSVASGSASTGSFLVEGGVVNSGGLNIATSGDAVGSVTITGGAWTNDVNYVNIGNSVNGTGYLTVSGGEFYTPKRVRIGSGGTGRLTIENHGVFIDGSSVDENYMCFGGPDSVLRLNEGGKLYLRSILRDNEANGTVEFNGGEMIKTVENGAYGGWVGSIAIDENHTIKILAGGMIFNSDYLSTCKGSILCPEGCGGITKRGAGELNLNTNGDRTFEFSGPIYVEGGTLRFSGNAQLPDFVDVIRVAEGATLVIPHDVTCRVLENNGTIQGGTVTVEPDAATKVAAKAVWTGAMGDGNVFNAKNYIVYDQNDRVMYEQTITVDTPVIVQYNSGVDVSVFVGFSDVTWIVAEDVCSEGYSRPAVLKTAAVWYDPSDTDMIAVSDGKVTAIKNKGVMGADMDLQVYESDPASIGTEGLNGRQSVHFTGNSGYRSEGKYPASLPPNASRTLFAVGDGGDMYLISASQNSSAEEGRVLLLTGSWGNAMQTCQYKTDSETWDSAKVTYNRTANKPYVFMGRTELGAEEMSTVTAVSLAANGTESRNAGSFYIPDQGNNLELRSYYGLFRVNSDFSLRSNGYQGEAIVFTNALTDAEMAEVGAYLKSKWLDAMPVMPGFGSLVVNAQVDLGGATRTFGKLSGSGSFVDGTVVLTGDLVVTVNPDQSVVVPTFDKLVLGPSARLVVNGAKNLPTGNTINIIPFTSLEGKFSSVLGEGNARVTLRYFEDHVCARRDAGLCVIFQ